MADSMLRCLINEESNVIRILHGGKLDPKDPKAARKRKTPNNGPVVGRWTKKEHKLFVEGRPGNHKVGLKRHGKQWSTIQDEIKSRTIAQIRTHAQKFFLKVSRLAPKGADPIEYIRGRPTDDFVNASGDEGRPSNGEDEVEPDPELGSNDDAEYPEEREAQAPMRDEEPADPYGSPAPAPSQEKRSVSKPSNQYRETRGPAAWESNPNQNEGKGEEPPPAQFEPAAEGAKPGAPMPPMAQAYRGAAQVPAMSQLGVMQDCLAKIKAELSSITQGLEADLNARMEKMPNSSPSYSTYNSLYNCSTTLQQVAAAVTKAHNSAIYLNHFAMNSNSFFRQPNFAYPPPGYYAPASCGNN